MAEFSQLVRGRLAAQMPATVHLDADVLAAFAEDRLSGRDRTLALAHLSTCAECREVVALASQEDAVHAAPPAAVHRPGKVLAWRLGLVGALAVLAVSATVLLRLEQPEPTLTARVSPPRQPDAALVANAPEVNGSAERTAEPRESRSDKAETKNSNGALRAQHSAETADSLSELSRRSADAAPATTPNLPAQTRRAEPLIARAPPPPPPPAPSTTFDQATQASTQPAAQSRAQQTDTLDVQAAAPRGQKQMQLQPGAAAGAAGGTMSRSDATLATAKAAPAITAEPQRPTPSANEMEIQQRSPVKLNRAKAAAARWTISSDGKLERAIEAGRQPPVWQPVDVGEAATFRVVNATGADVWAGGNSGALFHSSDSGASWVRVAPDDNGRKLEGDVTSIHVAGAGNEIVRLHTSASQTWITNDGGKTWKIESR